jgi:hypothetical protein
MVILTARDPSKGQPEPRKPMRCCLLPASAPELWGPAQSRLLLLYSEKRSVSLIWWSGLLVHRILIDKPRLNQKNI